MKSRNIKCSVILARNSVSSSDKRRKMPTTPNIEEARMRKNRMKEANGQRSATGRRRKRHLRNREAGTRRTPGHTSLAIHSMVRHRERGGPRSSREKRTGVGRRKQGNLEGEGHPNGTKKRKRRRNG